MEKAAEERGTPLPKHIKEKPILDIGLVWYWESFIILCSERLKDYGEIPYSSIRRYYKDSNDGLLDDSFESFLRVIRAIDKVYLEKQSDKANK